jgi:hypothetical protein
MLTFACYVFFIIFVLFSPFYNFPENVIHTFYWHNNAEIFSIINWRPVKCSVYIRVYYRDLRSYRVMGCNA